MPFLTKSLSSVVILVLSAATAAASVTVGAGSSVSFGDAVVDLGCQDLLIGGQAAGTAETLNSVASLSIAPGGSFAPGAGSVSLGGDFTDAGSFVPGASRVSIVDACGNGTSRMAGATNFYDFSVITASAKQLVMPAGATQSVVHALTLQGAAGNLLGVASSSTGVHALLAVGTGTIQTVVYVNARDNTASGATIAPGTPAHYNSVDSGGLINWFGSAVDGGNASVPAPLLDTLGFVFLLLGLLCIAAESRRASANIDADTGF